jgi:hypothetical protein
MSKDLQGYNIKIVPVTITYERMYDAELLTRELLAGKKQD